MVARTGSAERGGQDELMLGLDCDLRAVQERMTRLELRVPLGVLASPLIFLAAIPVIYYGRKNYGAGAKQVAQDAWDHPENLNTNAAKDGTAVEYTAKAGKNAEIEITHNDGTKQKHKLVPPGQAPNLGANPPECSKVTITYDKDGHPISVIWS